MEVFQTVWGVGGGGGAGGANLGIGTLSPKLRNKP